MTPTFRTLAISTAAVAMTLFAFARPAAADDMASLATGGYVSGLRTMAMMHMIDTNKDGVVSAGEWNAFQERTFDALDKDKSGYLDEKEFTGTGKENLAFATAAYAHGLMTHEMFKKIDANGDGKISKDEFLSYQRKIFEMLDKGKKGMVGPTDFIRKGG
jgi:hypothetical protein